VREKKEEEEGGFLWKMDQRKDGQRRRGTAELQLGSESSKVRRAGSGGGSGECDWCSRERTTKARPEGGLERGVSLLANLRTFSAPD
jgi:hypothetical protein